MVSGLIYQDGAAYAGYQARWTVGQVVRHGAHFLVVTGPWGEAAKPADRIAVALGFRHHEDGSGSSFTVLDANPPEPDLAGRGLRRDEVIGTPLAKEIFGMVDFIWLNDPRLAELTGLDYGCPEAMTNLDEEEGEALSDIPGFDEGRVETERDGSRAFGWAMVAGAWFLGCLFLLFGLSLLTKGSGLMEKGAGAAFAAVSVLAIVRVTIRGRRRGK